MRSIWWGFLCLVMAALGACSGAEMSRNVYEGVRVRDDLRRTPAERATAPSMPADDYDKQRKELRRPAD